MIAFRFMWITIATLLAYLLPNYAGASNIVHACHYCISDDAWQAAAEQRGMGNHYLYNRPQGQIRRYAVSREDFIPGQWSLLVTAMPVPAEVQDHFANLLVVLDWLDTNPPGSDAHFSIPVLSATPSGDPLHNATVYDVLQFPHLMNRLRDIVAAHEYDSVSNNVVRAALAAVAQNLNRAVLGDRAVTLDFKFVFQDGGTIVLRISPDHYYAEPVAGTARDASGNPVALNSAGISLGTYGFQQHPTDVPRWVNWMETLGVVIEGAGSSYRCTQQWKDGRYEVVCKRT